MKTLTQPAATALALPDPDARAAWRRRVARVGALIQLAFAALWLVRGALATGWPGRLPIATVAQLAASCALPFLVSALGRADLTITTIAVTIGILLLWLWARLATPGHLAAGVLLIVVPGGLAAAAGLTTAAILTGSALAGFRALTSRALGSPPPASRE